MAKLLIWAHRGASRLAPENTLSAFSAAVDAGADGIELDIQLSRDRIPVVIHDETVARTTNGAGRVRDLTLRELKSLDAGSWFAPEFAGEQIPSLSEVLEAFAGRIRLNLEIKEPRAGLAVLDLLIDWPQAELVVSSFNWWLLAQLRRLAPELPLAVLLEGRSWHQALRVARELSVVSLNPRCDQVGRLLLTACRRQGLPVTPWVVDQPQQFERLCRSGVAGVFSNDPATLVACRRHLPIFNEMD